MNSKLEKRFSNAWVQENLCNMLPSPLSYDFVYSSNAIQALHLVRLNTIVLILIGLIGFLQLYMPGKVQCGMGLLPLSSLVLPFASSLAMLKLGVEPRVACSWLIISCWLSSTFGSLFYGGIAFYAPRAALLIKLTRFTLSSKGMYWCFLMNTMSIILLYHGHLYSPSLSNSRNTPGQYILRNSKLETAQRSQFDFSCDFRCIMWELLLSSTIVSTLALFGERAHNVAQRKMREAGIHKTEFVARMSHELRTPLFGISGCLEMLADSGLDSQQESLLQMAQTCSKSLMGLIDDVLDMSKIEVGKLELNIQLIDTHKLIDESLSVIWTLANKKGINLKQVRKSKLPRFFLGDRLRNRQVLINLLSNSVKFTPPGGTITLYVKRVPEIPNLVKPSVCSFSPQFPAASLTNQKMDGYILLKVKDTGIGLSPSEMERIFEPFEQVDSSTARCTGGSGLGLTISASLVAQMGGQFTVCSRGKGQGSTFCYFIPYITGNQQPLPQRGDIHTEIAKRKNFFRSTPSASMPNLDISHIKPSPVNGGSSSRALSSQASSSNQQDSQLEAPQSRGVQAESLSITPNQRSPSAKSTSSSRSSPSSHIPLRDREASITAKASVSKEPTSAFLKLLSTRRSGLSRSGEPQSFPQSPSPSPLSTNSLPSSDRPRSQSQKIESPALRTSAPTCNFHISLDLPRGKGSADDLSDSDDDRGSPQSSPLGNEDRSVNKEVLEAPSVSRTSDLWNRCSPLTGARRHSVHQEKLEDDIIAKACTPGGDSSDSSKESPPGLPASLMRSASDDHGMLRKPERIRPRKLETTSDFVTTLRGALSPTPLDPEKRWLPEHIPTTPSLPLATTEQMTAATTATAATAASRETTESSPTSSPTFEQSSKEQTPEESPHSHHNEYHFTNASSEESVTAFYPFNLPSRGGSTESIPGSPKTNSSPVTLKQRSKSEEPPKNGGELLESSGTLTSSDHDDSSTHENELKDLTSEERQSILRRGPREQEISGEAQPEELPIHIQSSWRLHNRDTPVTTTENASSSSPTDAPSTSSSETRSSQARSFKSPSVPITPELEAMVASFCPKDLPSMTVSAAIQSKPASILVVEDNPINQKILEMMLAKLGYSCHLAANGIEAVQKACSYPYSLIFLDIEMPEMPGTTAAKIMRQKGISTPIVALSAHVLLEVQKDALEAGMDQFVTKPIKVATLKRILERWMPSSQ